MPASPHAGSGMEEESGQKQLPFEKTTRRPHASYANEETLKPETLHKDHSLKYIRAAYRQQSEGPGSS